ncbi:penicillin-binding protein [Bombilactobacillus bombi]|uniref:Penicillin-binding protein n=1 Tax=Bombilactobacillus bombi TaxID=1303590 RepID=A0A3R6XRJ4_9LACO|nr:transglycosylase domain-containing protein [Bombilactobacillus bombi]RHW45971.1 penicillin-binding protein [Bombilactobacillus bombi]
MANSRIEKYHRQKKPQKSHHKGLKYLLNAILALIVIMVVVFVYYGISAPRVNSEILQSGGSSTIYDHKGQEITTLGNENRTYITIDKVPQTMKDAIISTEDRHFYQEHLGFNPFRIFMAAINNLRGDSIQGGSTLTQQLIKLSVFSTKKSDQTLKRKMQEVWLAVKVERNFSKDQILEYYLNKVYLANGTYGFQTAAHYYFGKNLNQLTLEQMALLAGMPQAPNNYDPYKNPDAAKTRRDLVLKAMYNNHKITLEQAQNAKNTPITAGLKAYRPNTGVGENKLIVDPYIKEVIHEVKAKGFDPYRDNLKITVNMDTKVQKRLYEIVNSDEIAFPNNLFQTGVSVVDPNNGAVIAMIGGRKLGDVQLGLNRAVQTSRSNGSTMKPILDYAPAIEYLHWPTNQIVRDTPYTYPGTNISLNNWDYSYMGNITMRTALAESRNVPAIRTLGTVGFDRARKFARNMGINVPQNEGLSAGIGSEVSSLQLASAYSAFANGGTYYKPSYVSKIQTIDGFNHHYDPTGKKVMSEATAYLITDILKDVVKPTGMGSQAYISGLYQAGKTGSSNYSNEEIARNPSLANMSKDTLFTGYTKNYAIGVWTGYDQPNLHGLDATQQKIAAQIYQHLMRYLAAHSNNQNWNKPYSVVRVAGTNILYIRHHRPNNIPAHSTINNNNDNSANEVVPNRGRRAHSNNSAEFGTDDDNRSNSDWDNNSNSNSNNNNSTNSSPDTTTPPTNGNSATNPNNNTDSNSNSTTPPASNTPPVAPPANNGQPPTQ